MSAVLIEMARRHVDEAEAHIARQREIIETLRQRGRDLALAGQTLANFETVLALHREHLAQLEIETRETNSAGAIV